MRARRLVLPSVTMVVLLGCKSTPVEATPADAGGGPAPAASTGGRVASCDRSTLIGTCSEYDPGYFAQHKNLLTDGCAKLSGTFAFSECPNTSVLGTCKMPSGERRKFYAAGKNPYDAERARKECETSFLHGSWQAL